MIKPTLPSSRVLLGVAGTLALLGVVLIGTTLLVVGRTADARATATRTTVAAAATTAEPARSAAVATVSAEPTALAETPDTGKSTVAPPASSAAVAALAAASKAAAAKPAPAATKPATKPAAKAKAAASSGPDIDAYRGLGSWVDIYDDRAWADPAATVADMAKHGVRTLYIETANSRSTTAIVKPEQLKAFIDAAHAHGIKVVAWYLPDLKDLSKDSSRIQSAIDLTTARGGKFDSFALDIESGAVKAQDTRNQRLMALTDKIRAHVGASYPLGAIIPSPFGLSRKGSYWSSLPYESLAKAYDVFVPMSYYTYHGDGGAKAYADTIANMRILRSKPGCAKAPVHLIGGEASKSSVAEVEQFVRAARETGAVGASLYSWPGTNAALWKALKPIVP